MKRLSYIQDAPCLRVKCGTGNNSMVIRKLHSDQNTCQGYVTKIYPSENPIFSRRNETRATKKERYRWGETKQSSKYFNPCMVHHLSFFIVTNKCTFNHLKPTGYVMRQQFNIQQLYALPTLYLCVLYLSENKQRLVPLTA